MTPKMVFYRQPLAAPQETNLPPHQGSPKRSRINSSNESHGSDSRRNQAGFARADLCGRKALPPAALSRAPLLQLPQPS